jgi:predicted dehydrogenase
VAQFDRVTCLLDTNWCSLGSPGAPGITPGLVTVEGSAGTVCLMADGTLTLQSEQSQAAWQFPDSTIIQSYVAAQQHFVECLLADRQPETSGLDTLQTLALVFAAYQSAAEGRVIWLSSPGS